jgi:membrane protein implicated in regulation of membrane protease activity
MTIAHVYLAFLIIGVIGLLSSLIFGDFGHGDLDHDFGGADGGTDLHSDTDSPKILSLRVIFAFLLAFSIGGGALYLGEKSLGLQLITGFAAGIATAVAVYYLMKFLYSFQGVSNIDSKDFLLKEAVVSVGTTSTGMCQVEVDSTGGDRLFMAKEANGEILTKNDIVKITDRKGSTLIVVKK